MTFIYI